MLLFIVDAVDVEESSLVRWDEGLTLSEALAPSCQTMTSSFLDEFIFAVACSPEDIETCTRSIHC